MVSVVELSILYYGLSEEKIMNPGWGERGGRTAPGGQDI